MKQLIQCGVVHDLTSEKELSNETNLNSEQLDNAIHIGALAKPRIVKNGIKYWLAVDACNFQERLKNKSLKGKLTVRGVHFS